MAEPERPITGEFRELAALYALGVLPADEAQAVAAMLAEDGAAGAPDLRAEVAAFQETAARLSFTLPPAEPRPELRDRLFERIRPRKKSGFAELLPGVHVLRAASAKWRQTPFPGVTAQTLFIDRETGIATSLLRMEAGSIYPRHLHTADEQCYVIEGDIGFGGIALGPGDFERADPNTVHEPITTQHGCLLLIIASVHDELMA